MSEDRRLVVGLGNPGDKYRYTRHNIAWVVLDAFADRVSWRGGGKRRDAAMVHSGRVLGLDLVMAKPDTFMNESGIAVRKLLAAERVPLTALLVVVDDFSLPFGTLRFREGGSAGGHNGLTSITDELGTDKYPRLRVGIGDPRESGTAHQHVLGEFTAAERLRLPEVEVAAGEAIELWARSGLNKAATAFNGWALPEPEAGSAA
ncbi:MAG: aminoacyl-tRNA hydrolase, partial [Chloroflexi bacterium]|nr:aminoacyl-tRNA hydrolase [Chloroflexota bacterium]